MIRSRSSFARTAPYAVLILAVFAAYANVYFNHFLYDDDTLIVGNSWLGSWNHVIDLFSSHISGDELVRQSPFYRPLQMLLYLFVYQAAGLSTIAFHFLNIALHALNGCLVYRLGCKLGFQPGVAGLAALLWAMHPAHVEAIAYMSGTADPLSVGFILSGLVVLLPDFTPRRVLVALVLFLLALLGKESAVVFPLLVMTCLFLISPKRSQPKSYVKTWPFWALTFMYVIARIVLGGSLNMLPSTLGPQEAYHNSMLVRCFSFLAVIPTYAEILLWPHNLHMERGAVIYEQLWNGRVVEGAGFFVAAASIFFAALRSEHVRPLSWGVLWFAAAFLPNTGILLPINAMVLEHWLYLPSIGLFLGVGQALSNFISRENESGVILAITIALVLGLALGVMTYRQNRIWRNPIVFYTNIIDNGEASPIAHNNLGLFYASQHAYDKALEEFQTASTVTPNFPDSHYNAAVTLLLLPDGDKNIAEAIEELERGVTLEPQLFPAYVLLAKLYTYTGQKALARDALHHARDIGHSYSNKAAVQEALDKAATFPQRTRPEKP